MSPRQAAARPLSQREAARIRRAHAPKMVGGPTGHPICELCTDEATRSAAGEVREVAHPCRHRLKAEEGPQPPGGPPCGAGAILVAAAAAWSVLALLLAMVTPWPVAVAILLVTVGSPAWLFVAMWRRSG